MAFTGINEVRPASRGVLLRSRVRVDAFFSGEHFAAQKAAGAAFAIRVASAGIVFASQVLLARWLGSYEFGSYVFVWTCLLLAGDLVHFGLPLTAQRFIPEYTQAKSFALLRGYLRGTRWLSLTTAVLIAAVGAAVVNAISDRIDPGLVISLYFGCAAVPAYALSFMTDGVARSYNWMNLALLPAYVFRPLLLIAGAAGLHVVGVQLTAANVLAVLTGAAWIAVLAQILQLDIRLHHVVPAGPKHYRPRSWFAAALPMVFVWGLYTLLTSTDVLVLKYFRSADEVAHYFAAAKVLALISMVHFAVSASTAHRFTAYQVAGDRAGLADFAARTVRWVFWTSLALVVAILAVGRPVLWLFGPDFVSGYPVMAILAAGMLARASVGPAERLLNMLGHQRGCAVAYMVALGVNLAGCLLLAPHYGAIGAGIATAASFIVESLLLFIIAKHSAGVHMFIWRRGASI